MRGVSPGYRPAFTWYMRNFRVQGEFAKSTVIYLLGICERLRWHILCEMSPDRTFLAMDFADDKILVEGCHGPKMLQTGLRYY